MRRLKKHTLKKIRSKLRQRSEICGIVAPSSSDKDILELKSLDNGPYIHDGERGSCRSTNIWINYHTHPLVVWPWPSTEDIFKVLVDRGDRPVLWGSLIFAEWGIWEIFSHHKVPRRKLDEKEEWWTVNASDELFYALKLDEKPKVPLLSTVHKPLQSYVDLWGEAFDDLGFRITLTDWKDIPGDYYLQTGLQDVPLDDTQKSEGNK